MLNKAGSEPNSLHQNLLRLFRTKENVRIVTTNFDLHFETAARQMWDESPEIYTAPALPLGNDFRGIVHVHGSLAKPESLVLTDADFGRAYLTEGWARRFLVALFQKYTVLFIGYSHDDPVMQYLARGMSPERIAGRFALDVDAGKWDSLGVKPLLYPLVKEGDLHVELYRGIQRLAERLSRGMTDWKTRITDICLGNPPVDDETISEVEQILQDVATTRLFTDRIYGIDWFKWLDKHKHLDMLFQTAALQEAQASLAYWAAEHYAIKHPNEMLEMIITHNAVLNPTFWHALCRSISLSKDTLSSENLLKYVDLLLMSAPDSVDDFMLFSLAERCANQKVVEGLFRIFLFMCKMRVVYSLSNPLFDQENKDIEIKVKLIAGQYPLEETWKRLKPYLANIHRYLLTTLTQRLEDIHQSLIAWNKGRDMWGSGFGYRAAIEKHEQDWSSDPEDIVFDAIRDCLEWLSQNLPSELNIWIEQMASSPSHLLQRFSIYAMGICTDKAADRKLMWLLEKATIYDRLLHHEVYQFTAKVFPAASDDARKALVNAILSQKYPDSEDDRSGELTDRLHFDWLSWLIKAKSDCQITEAALSSIKAKYPEWLPSDHADFRFYHYTATWSGTRSPLTAEQLVSMKPTDHIDEWLSYKEERFEIHGPTRDGFLTAITEACTQDVNWSISLSATLADRGAWNSDIWSSVIQAWRKSQLTADIWRTILSYMDNKELLLSQIRDWALLLFSLVENGSKPYFQEILDEVNPFAEIIWENSENADTIDAKGQWLTRAINHPAGIMVEYWLSSLSALLRDKKEEEGVLPDYYRELFTKVVQSSGDRGAYGRCILASRLAVLFHLNGDWTREYLLPLFMHTDNALFQQVWDGFLTWGRLNPLISDALLPAFEYALEKLDLFYEDIRKRFVQFVAALSVFHIYNPLQSFLPVFYKHASQEDRNEFLHTIEAYMRDMDADAKSRLWNGWLHQYWENRLAGVFGVLVDNEVELMLGWLLYLDDQYPEAVKMAIRCPAVQSPHYRMLPYQLQESELVERYQSETAALLMYLLKSSPSHTLSYLANTVKRLSALSDDMKRQLNEELMRAGVSPVE